MQCTPHPRPRCPVIHLPRGSAPISPATVSDHLMDIGQMVRPEFSWFPWFVSSVRSLFALALFPSRMSVFCSIADFLILFFHPFSLLLHLQEHKAQALGGLSASAARSACLCSSATSSSINILFIAHYKLNHVVKSQNRPRYVTFLIFGSSERANK